MVYYADMVAQRRKQPSDDLTSALLEAEIDGDRLTDEEIMAFLFLMVVAGTRPLRNCLPTRRIGVPRTDQLAPVFTTTPRYRYGSRRPCATTRPARSWRAPCPAS